MNPVSRKKMEIETDVLFSELLKTVFSKPNSKIEASKILTILLTPTELKMLKKRIGIILLLNEGFTQDEISKTTKTTRQTVDRIRLQLLEVEKEQLTYFYQTLKSIATSYKLKEVIKEISNMDNSRSSTIKKVSPIKSGSNA